jgi:colanic acid/amylovoran biosynthesis glycosyltransferase
MTPNPMKIAYITKQLPFGVSEAFILPEVADHRAQGWDVWFVPLARGAMLHDPALLANTMAMPVLSPQILCAALAELIQHPRRTARLCGRMLRARSLRLALRNLAVFPKGLWLGRRLKKDGFQHIHIHFAAAPATMGVVAAQVSGLPWSITAHRYDIAQNNLLGWKAGGASFLRAIDAAGAAEIRGHVGARAMRLLVLYMGVPVPGRRAPLQEGGLATLRLAIAARLVGKKGHGHLLEAMALARAGGQDVSLEVFGDGPLEAVLRQHAQRLGIDDAVVWRGATAHHAMLDALLSGCFDAAVLPSVTTRDGDKEGIPVFLIEAMAVGLPVLTTANGGIIELAGGGVGLLVPEGDAPALAAAMIRLAQDGAERVRLAEAGRVRVLAEFEIGANMQVLRGLMSGTTASDCATTATADT